MYNDRQAISNRIRESNYRKNYMHLTPHFTLEELTRSSTAERLQIDNTPPKELLPNLQTLAEGLEKVRVSLGIFNAPMYIDSGYRCPTLNKAVRGAVDSAHMTGFAADFISPLTGTPLEMIQTLAKGTLAFDELIQEGSWVHISFAPAMRRKVLTAHFGLQGTTYTIGVPT